MAHTFRTDPIPSDESKRGGPKRYLVNPPFQIRVMVYLLLMAALVVISSSATINYFFYDFIQKGVEVGLPPGHIFFAFIEKQQVFMNQLLGGLFAFLSIVLIISGMILSHRVAGPLHRLNTHMKAVASGRTKGPVVFRESDFFKELADSYNDQYAALTALEEPPLAEKQIS